MTCDKVLALVLAGGEGTRLRPLTAQQAKPAVPFADGHRIVDFVLGNLVNSRVEVIYLLAQYKPASLIEHIEAVWAPGQRASGNIVDVLLPSATAHKAPFIGTADAVRSNLDLLQRHEPDVVAVFAADHIYRMDVRQIVAFHERHGADVTIAGIPVPIEAASAFGIMAMGEGGRLERFEEKPKDPRPLPGDPGHALASMGNYLFRPSALIALLQETGPHERRDFGRDLLPTLPMSGYRALAYDFAQNEVPGIRPCEERSYWRDVGTLDALAQARRDVEEPLPRFSLYNPQWPIRRDRISTSQYRGHYRAGEALLCSSEEAAASGS